MKAIPSAGSAALFIVAASSRLARGRVARTVVRGLDTWKAPPDTESESVVRRMRDADGRVHAWSIRGGVRLESSWQSVSPGDWFLFYQAGFFSAAARVGATFENQSLAAAIWGADEAENLRRVVLFDEAKGVWAPAWREREVLGARFLGFRRVAADRQSAIRHSYESVEAYMRKVFLPTTSAYREGGRRS